MQETNPMLGRSMVPDMPSVGELLPWLRRIDAGRWYSNFGPLVTEFEQRMQAHLAAADQVTRAEPIALTTLISCYHALQIGLQILHLPENANVLVPSVTFPACPLAVRHARARAVLADIDFETWQLTPAIARRIATRMPIHAVMPVAVYGVPVPAEEWDRFAEDTGIPVIIDAAAALEAQPIPRHCLVAHSLHATKPFSIGEGGLLIARDRKLIEEARCIANFGTQNRIAVRDGSNAKLSEYHGAVALAQLARWAEVKQRRRAMFARLRAAIEDADLGLAFQKGIEQAIPSTFMLEMDAPRAETMTAALNERGILAHRMYLPPLYHHPHFADLAIVQTEGYSLPGAAPKAQKVALMENSEQMQRHLFGLPFHAFLEERDIACMIEALAEAMSPPREQSRPAKTARA